MVIPVFSAISDINIGTRHSKNTRRHREVQTDYISIHERPGFINQRQRIGDWEIDTVIGRTGHSILLTVVDRLSRLTLIKKVVQKDSQEINKGLVELLGAIPKEFVHSITPDHGTEFLHLDEISERLGVTVYWPDPYSPEQRGTNENTNGLIREYFPFAKISKNGVPAAAIILSAALVLITPLMSLTTAISSVFTIVTGVSSDMYIIVYTLAMIAHRKYRVSSDFLPNGFVMPWYKVTSPLTIFFFGVIFVSLFFIPEDIIGAIGAIVWTLVFGSIEYFRQQKTASANIDQYK